MHDTIIAVKQVVIFANPIAGRGKGKHIAQSLRQRLSAHGHTVHPILRRPHDLNSADLEPVKSARAIIIIGGDGTLRSVVQALLRHGHAPPPPIVLVPMGTANLMGKYLGLRWSDTDLAVHVLDVIENGRRLDVDAARMRDDEIMLLMAGIGLDAKIIHELDRIRQGPISMLSYALPAALAVGFYTYPKIRVTVDSKQIWEGSGIAMVGNIKEYGTGFPVLPDARPDDGILDVCALPCKSRGELLSLFLAAAAGEHLQAEGAVYVRGVDVKIDSDEPVPIQVDGEAAGFTPVSIQLLDHRIPFLVPQS